MCATCATKPYRSQNATSIGNFIPNVWTCRHGRSTSTPSRWSRPIRPRRRCLRVTTTSAAASTSSPRTSQGTIRSLESDVEADLEHVAVGDFVVLAFHAQPPDFSRLRPRANLEQLIPADDFGADEAALQVRVNHARAFRCLGAGAERPRARLL